MEEPGANPDHGHHDQLLGRLFAILTVRLEEAGELAISGQSGRRGERIEAAEALIDSAEDLRTISEAVLLICGEGKADLESDAA